MTDALELLAELATARASATEVVSAHLAALRRVHGATNAVVAFEDERALADAAALDAAFARTGPVGPLHGLPITVKDWIDVEGFTCEGAAPGPRERRPARDATVVARLRRAGAVVVAKTAAWGPTDGDGRVRHPHDPSRTPGGSSTGEAVVVAAGASPLGIGSDSGGSVRLPAAWCGVFGFKPTAGLVPTTGHYPRVGARSDGRTQIGPLTRDLTVIELVLPLIAGPDGRDAGVASARASAPRRNASFAVLTAEGSITADDASTAAAERGADALVRAGLRRVAWTGPWLADALDVTQRYWDRTRLSGADADRQLRDWDRFCWRYLAAAADVDLLLTPTVRTPAPGHRPVVGDDFVFTLPASLTGSPAISVPVDGGSPGAPLSVQLVGRPWEDVRVLAAARLIPRLTA